MNCSFEPKKSKRHALLILAAAVLWGTTPLFVTRLALLSLSSYEMLFYRAGFAVLWMAGYMLFRDRSLFRIRLRDTWIFVGSGVLAFAFFSFCYSESIRQSSPAVAAALLYTAPAFLVFFSAWLFGERLTAYKLLAVLFVTVGAFTVSGLFLGGAFSPAGVLLGLLSGFGYALYTVFSRIGLRRYSSLTVTFYSLLFAFLVSLFFIRPSTLAVGFSEPSGFLTVLLYSTVTCLLPYLLYTAGLSQTPPAVAGILATVEPVVAALFGVFLLAEPFTPFKAIGILLILSGVLLPEAKSLFSLHKSEKQPDRKET